MLTSESRPQRSVAGGLSLFLGGARSGKSDLVVSLARQWSGPVMFVATAEAHDDDMAERIRSHQADRPTSWGLLERPRLADHHVQSLPADTLLIVDCLTLLVSNLMLSGKSATSIVEQLEALAQSLSTRAATTLVVSNEVGLGVHPATKMGASYRDTLGVVNRTVAAHARDVFLVFAGRVLPLSDIELIQTQNNESRQF